MGKWRLFSERKLFGKRGFSEREYIRKGDLFGEEVLFNR